LAVDGKLQELESIFYDLHDMMDDFTDWQVPSAVLPLQQAIFQIRVTIMELKIHRLKTLCQFIRFLHHHWQLYGRPLYLDLDLA